MMKKALFLFSVLTLTVTFLHAQVVHIDLDLLSGKRQPNPSEVQAMRAEEANHPNIAAAMHEVEGAMAHLKAAPDGEFGGHKGDAEVALRQAWFSLRKALYFRLYHGG